MVNMGNDAEIAQHCLLGGSNNWRGHGANIRMLWLQIHSAFGLPNSKPPETHKVIGFNWTELGYTWQTSSRRSSASGQTVLPKSGINQ
jgi:hypothetical protein